MAQYDKATATATRLIKKFGGPAVLRRFSDAALPDAEKPWRRSKPNTTDTTVDAVFLSPGDVDQRYLPTTEVETGDKLVYISGGSLAEPPRLKDRLYRDGAGPDDEGWSITAMATLDPNGQQVLHTLLVRR